MKLQLALDGTLEDGLQALRPAQPWVDVVEAGTPLLLREGVSALRRLRAATPDTPLLADFKIMDAGDLEARLAFDAGADQVTVLGVANDATIASALAAARDCGGEILVDLMAVPQPLQRVQGLLALGCERFCVHRAHDGCGDPVAPLRELRAALPELQLAVAGGIDERTIEALAPYCPDTVIVGSAITGAAQPGLAARRIMEKMRAHV
ncbi:MAG: orotidine 5'-phosphate decarboxylase [Anaerolineaceae bacterium]|nr:orotidine 5'-phosphate decarboxylase [Anaerolineaceae bacterium]